MEALPKEEVPDMAVGEDIALKWTLRKVVLRKRNEASRRHGDASWEWAGWNRPMPTTQATVKAPDEFYNLVNPLENTPNNIEKGRLLFLWTCSRLVSCVMGTRGMGPEVSRRYEPKAKKLHLYTNDERYFRRTTLLGHPKRLAGNGDAALSGFAG